MPPVYSLWRKKSVQLHRGFPTQIIFFVAFFWSLLVCFFKVTRDATWRVVPAGATSAHTFAVFWIHYSADTESCCPSGAPPPAVCLSAPAALLVYICTCSQCVRSVGRADFFYFFCIGFTRRNNTICRVACVCLLHVYDFPVDGRGFCCHFEQHVATTAWAPHKTIHEMCFNALSDINVQQEEPSVKLLATSVEFTQKDYRMLAYFYMDLFVYWLFKYLYYLTFCNSISSISMCHYCYHCLNLQLDFSICTIFFFAFLKCISYY